MSNGLDELLDAYGLKDADRQAVADAYQVFLDNHGPFITSVAAQMLPDLHADAEEGRTLAFLGRDGHPYAVAASVLEPDFFGRYCREVVLSRGVAEAAVQDLETYTGTRLLDGTAFRREGGRVHPSAVPGAYQRLTRYLRASGIPVGREGCKVTVVDSCFKGTIQELLAAAYPGPVTDFRGRYAMHGAVSDDPHPGSKTGYVVHLQPGQNPDMPGSPLTHLPYDPSLTFAYLHAVRAVEHSLNGPLGTATALTAGGRPHQERLRDDPAYLDGFNPAQVREPLRKPLVREAAKAAAVLAVHDAAARAAADRDAGHDWKGALSSRRDQFTSRIRAWLTRDPGADPGLSSVLDSLVRPEDHHINTAFARVVLRHGLTADGAMHLWEGLALCRTTEEKQALTARVAGFGKAALPRPTAREQAGTAVRPAPETPGSAPAPARGAAGGQGPSGRAPRPGVPQRPPSAGQSPLGRGQGAGR